MIFKLLKELTLGNDTVIEVDVDIELTGKSERLLFEPETNPQIKINKFVANQVLSLTTDKGKVITNASDKEKLLWVRQLTTIDRRIILYHIFRDSEEGETEVFINYKGQQIPTTVPLKKELDIPTDLNFEAIELQLSNPVVLNGVELNTLFLSPPLAGDMEFIGRYGDNAIDFVLANLSCLIKDSNGIKYSVEEWQKIKSKHRRNISEFLPKLPSFDIICESEIDGEIIPVRLDVEGFFISEKER